MKFLFTCGGTAGHINPALAVAGRIREAMPDAEFLFIGAEGRIETDLVPRAGYEIKTVKITNISRGLRPADFVHNFVTLSNIFSSLGEAKRIIRDFGPDVAVGTGGYVCFPVLRAAAKLGIPTAVHESNAVPGLTTKVLEGTVDRVMVGFEESRGNYQRPEFVVVTGTPVRGDFLRQNREAAREILGIGRDKPLVVSVWGSLGAARMNEVVSEFIQRACGEPKFGLIHAAGKAGYPRMAAKLRQACPDFETSGIEVRDYIYNMPQVMAAADLVICRAGASTLAELTAMGKAAILVPSPNVTNNHQEKNARVLEKVGGARVILESELSPDMLFDTVSALLSDRAALDEMSGRMRELGTPDATERIADLVLGLASKNSV